MNLNRRQFCFTAASGPLACLFPVARSDYLFASSRRPADDWSQWGGPARNFVIPPLTVKGPLPKPKLQWSRELGQGQAAIVNRGDFGYGVHLDGEQEVVSKWRLQDGKIVWSFRYTISYHASDQYDGPHSTPSVADDRIIVTSIDGRVRAINTSTGQEIWNRDLKADFGFRLPQSGYACSPLIWKNLVILPTLGESQPAETESFNLIPQAPAGRAAIPGAVGLDIRTGRDAWRTTTFRSSHSSPIVVTIEQHPTLVFHGMFELVGVNPANGSVRWRQLLRSEAADNVSFTPIWDKERSQFLISHGYCRFGTQAIELTKSEGKWKTGIKWTNSQLQTVHTNAVLVGDTLVGTRRPSATLMVAIDVRDGKTVFRTRGFGKSNLLVIGSELLILDESGELIGGRLTREGIAESWRIPILTKSAWTVPSIVGRTILLRDNGQIKAYQFP